MSRAHMIYKDQPLQQEVVRTSRWQGRWDPQSLQRGAGVLLEGVFQKRVKHIVQDSEGGKHRFVVFHVEFKHGCQRKFDVHGHEVEPNFGQMGLVRTGYLHSSYKSEAKGIADILDFQEVNRRLQSPLAEFVPPQHAHSLCFWADEQPYDHVELAFGQAVRLKTKASLTRLDTEQKQYSANYAGGEKAGQSWTEKVMGVKQTQEPPKTLPQDLQEGVEEDEWDD